MRNLALVWVLAACLLGCGGKPSDTTFIDKRDGKVYKIVRIGSQVWFAENLNYAAKGSKCFGEGDKTFDREHNGETLTDAEIQANCAKYGRLYDWETALTACPVGTHLPTDKEWTTLVDYVGGDSTAGTKLKSSTGWESDKYVSAGTDEYGFSALPGGYGSGSDNGKFYDSTVSFYNAGYQGVWWSVTEYEYDADYVKRREICYDDERVHWDNFTKTLLFSVRCILDDEKERRK